MTFSWSGESLLQKSPQRASLPRAQVHLLPLSSMISWMFFRSLLRLNWFLKSMPALPELISRDRFMFFDWYTELAETLVLRGRVTSLQ